MTELKKKKRNFCAFLSYYKSNRNCNKFVAHLTDCTDTYVAKRKSFFLCTPFPVPEINTVNNFGGVILQIFGVLMQISTN